MLRQTKRELTAHELVRLRDALVSGERRAKQSLTCTALVTGVICGGLALVTLLASDAPWLVVIGFWTVTALAIGTWVVLEGRRSQQQQLASIKAALAYGWARVLEIESESVVEFEEFEDEGACWAFQVEPGLVLFVLGQEYYASDTFPSSRFDMLQPLLSGDLPLDEWLIVTGPKLEPQRVVPAETKAKLQLPGHLETANGNLDTIELTLPALKDM